MKELDIDVTDKIPTKQIYEKCFKCSGQGSIKRHKRKTNHWSTHTEIVYYTEREECLECSGEGKVRDFYAEKQYYRRQEMLLKQKLQNEFKQYTLKQKLWEKYVDKYNKETASQQISRQCQKCLGLGLIKKKQVQRKYSYATQSFETVQINVDKRCDDCQGSGKIFKQSIQPPIPSSYNQEKCRECLGSGKIKDIERKYSYATQSYKAVDVERQCYYCFGSGFSSNSSNKNNSEPSLLINDSINEPLLIKKPQVPQVYQPVYQVQAKKKSQAQLRKQFQNMYKGEKQIQKQKQEKQKQRQRLRQMQKQQLQKLAKKWDALQKKKQQKVLMDSNPGTFLKQQKEQQEQERNQQPNKCCKNQCLFAIVVVGVIAIVLYLFVYLPNSK